LSEHDTIQPEEVDWALLDDAPPQQTPTPSSGSASPPSTSASLPTPSRPAPSAPPLSPSSGPREPAPERTEPDDRKEHEERKSRREPLGPGAFGAGPAARSGPSRGISRRRSPERDDQRLRIGIIGGKQVGKSYLFQAMVYRTQVGDRSGALTYFLEQNAIELSTYTSPESPPLRVNLDEFLRSYESWTRLGTTSLEFQQWYKLRLGYRCGVFGTRRSALEIELLDGSGESFFEAPPGAENLEIWRHGFLGVRVMIFCLPLWAAFPRGDLTVEDWEQRDELLVNFQRVLGNYIKVREELDEQRPVRSILALTMADDGRSALDTLRQRWIEPYMEDPEPILQMLQRSSRTARYLNNARRISTAVTREFQKSPESRVARIVHQLDFGVGTPWMVPLSAIEGSELDRLGDHQGRSQTLDRLRPPVPVHVELPLLVALCEQTNALM